MSVTPLMFVCNYKFFTNVHPHAVYMYSMNLDTIPSILHLTTIIVLFCLIYMNNTLNFLQFQVHFLLYRTCWLKQRLTFMLYWALHQVWGQPNITELIWVAMLYECMLWIHPCAIHKPVPYPGRICSRPKSSSFKIFHVQIGHYWTYGWAHSCSFNLLIKFILEGKVSIVKTEP